MRALVIVMTALIGLALPSCKPKSLAEKYSTDELRKFEAEQAPKRELYENRLDRAKAERQDESHEEIRELKENIDEERAENLGEHQEELAELQQNIKRDDPKPRPMERMTRDAGTLP
jgi:hypothetical protein